MINIAIAHAAWAEGRRDGLAKIVRTLQPWRHQLFYSDRREHASTWAIRIWEWCAEQSDPTIVLNDDVIPHPQIREIVAAMFEAVGPRVLSLHPNNPVASQLYANGIHWMRAYVLTGPAYVLTPEGAASLLEWYDAAPMNFKTRINEDNYGIHWAWDRQEPIYCSIPALVEHDTSIPSTLGYDDHPNRKAYVHWRDEPLTDPSFWRTAAPWVPNTWAPPTYMANIRRMIRAGVYICDMCHSQPAKVGSGTCKVCMGCLSMCTTATLRGGM
jgi:hypothetical protein